jgi:hypothetical protein
LTTVVSEAHDWTKFPERNSKNIFAALGNKELANMEERYNTSKLMQILLLREVVLKAADDSVVINMVNPEFCRSNNAREHDLGIILLLYRNYLLGRRRLVVGRLWQVLRVEMKVMEHI